MNETACRHFEDALSTWVFEGTLEEKRLAPLKGHLKTCASCRRLKDDYAAMKPLMQEPPLKAPPALKVAVMNRITPSVSRRSWMGPLSFAAAASVLAVMFWGLNHDLVPRQNSVAIHRKPAAVSQGYKQADAALEPPPAPGAPSSAPMDKSSMEYESMEIPLEKTASKETLKDRLSEEGGGLLQRAEAKGGALPDSESMKAKSRNLKAVSEESLGDMRIAFKHGLRLKVLKTDLEALDARLAPLGFGRQHLTLTPEEASKVTYWEPKNEGCIVVDLSAYKSEDFELLEIIQKP